jgi:hypothetical protein
MLTLTQSIRSRSFAVVILGGLLCLLLLALAALGGRRPRFAEALIRSSVPRDPIPTAVIRTLFDAEVNLAAVARTNSPSLVFTRRFMPPVLPPPTTKKVELTYHGFYQTTEGPKTALIKAADAIVPVTAGGRVIANLFVADITWQALTITNSAAQTNLVPLNAKKEFEVPLQ